MNEGGLLGGDMLGIFGFGGLVEVTAFGGRVIVRVGPGGAVIRVTRKEDAVFAEVLDKARLEGDDSGFW